MEIGKKILEARKEAGLSQSQLCDGIITRNMLSQIEKGTANPSLATLEALSLRLQKPMGYFFGENLPEARDRSLADRAWEAYDRGDAGEAMKLLDSGKDLRSFRDVPVLRTLVLLELTEKAAEEKRDPYALQLLHRAAQENCHAPELRRRALLLQGRLEGQWAEPICRELPSLDPELLLRAEGALENRDGDRAAQLLEAAEEKKIPRWNLLRGKAYLLTGQYRSAARCFHQAETEYPSETAPFLEQCYRELEDFKQAYYYACRQK